MKSTAAAANCGPRARRTARATYSRSRSASGSGCRPGGSPPWHPWPGWSPPAAGRPARAARAARATAAMTGRGQQPHSHGTADEPPPQDPAAPRGAVLYPSLSEERLEEVSLDLMADLKPKGGKEK